MFFSCNENQSHFPTESLIYEEAEQFNFSAMIQNDSGEKVFADTILLETFGEKWPYDDLQWKIGWRYPFDLRTFYTGVIVSEDSIWIHPPRTGPFAILEGNAFPCVYPNDSIGSKRTITIRANPGDWFPLDSAEVTGTVAFKSIYTRRKDTVVNILGMERNAIHFDAITTSPLGVSRSNFLFDPPLGFVQMKFYTLHQETILLKLNVPTPDKKPR